MPEKIKVIIVDDASFMVKALTDILQSDPEIEVVASAKNGLDALDKIKLFKPDVVTLDVDMPVMDGVSAIRHIMINCPVPIVMLSSLFNHGEITFEALRLGVVDFIPKPSGAISKDIHEQSHKIIDRVKIAAAEHIDNVQRAKLNKIDVVDNLSETYSYKDLEHLIVMGTTLGGPNIIIQLMSKLSSHLSAAVVVIQEIESKILPAFVNEFNKYTSWKVEVGSEGKILAPGCCYICSYQEPMTVQVNQTHTAVLQSSQEEEKPLDALFSSAALSFEKNAIGILLTGVGAEGGDGLNEIKKQLGTTFAQKAETCVYPNLTQCAIEKGVVDITGDVNELCFEVEKIIGSPSYE